MKIIERRPTIIWLRKAFNESMKYSEDVQLEVVNELLDMLANWKVSNYKQ